MKTSFVKMWAITMTGMALLLLGVLIGKLIFNQPEKQQFSVNADVVQSNEIPPIESQVPASNSRPVKNHAKNPVTSTDNQSAESDNTQYITPDELANIKTEWRTAFINDQYNGYAALFDPQRREFIIEKCKHHGYFNEESQQPIGNGVPFCETFVFSQILTLTTESATLRTKTGEVVNMSLTLTNDNQLEISLLDTEIALMPGSKNDLFQLMDKSELIKKQKKALINWQEQEYQKERARQERSKNSGDLP